MMNIRPLVFMAAGAIFGACTPGQVQNPVNFNTDVRINANLRLQAPASELHYDGYSGSWLTGIDVANAPGYRDLVLAGKVNPGTSYAVTDFVYLSHNGSDYPTMGIGVTPPSPKYVLQISAFDGAPGMGSVQIRKSVNQTATIQDMIDSAGISRLQVDSNFWLTGDHPNTGGSLAIRGNQSSNKLITLADSKLQNAYSIELNSGAYELRNSVSGQLLRRTTATGETEFPGSVFVGKIRVAEPSGTPSSSTSGCNMGEITYSKSHIYVCVAPNRWMRSALESF